MQKSFFYFDEIYLIFSFVACAFGVTAKKSFPNLLSWCLCTSFSLRSFIIFTLRCLIHFQLICVYDVRPGFSFFFFFYVFEYLFFPAPFFWRQCFPYLHDLGLLARIHLTKYVRIYFWKHFSFGFYVCLYSCITVFWLLSLCGEFWTLEVWDFQLWSLSKIILAFKSPFHEIP